MKLYLSSYQLGNETDKLVSMVPENKRAAVIFNALDFSSDLERKQSTIDREINDLSEIGLEPEEFDLRHYFGNPESLKEKISSFGLIWAIGGNTFVLRRAMSQSGLDQFLIENRNNDTLIYAGYSAGACVLAPTLRGIDLVDDPHIAPQGYESNVIWEGLSLIKYSIAPHYKSNHDESELIDRAIEYFRENKIPFKALRDGEVIVHPVV